MGKAKGGKGRKKARKLARACQEAIYDALDKIRFHPVIADHLNKSDDSVKWYKASGRVLERLVSRLLARRGRR